MRYLLSSVTSQLTTPNDSVVNKYQDVVCQSAMFSLLLECCFGRKRFRRAIHSVRFQAWILEEEQDLKSFVRLFGIL